ncbi:hypothetical protein QTP70_015427 [Hemibagrus guttatus]|uniref:Reverse transcriptase/retrotransposon-derived protein RNase H-like domain-containing protein n=1 Tax=Hemibagrus guttatus TaxID=175788 RepID=A0AAE0QMF7_9TELE|nr:hypothetical protein QTP70_015427 [Hemibagrus guttatus]
MSGRFSPDYRGIIHSLSPRNEFHQITMTFLGYVITQQGVEMDVTKVQVVTEWPSPTTVKELQCFLGFANFYRCFIRNYSFVAGPLTSLLKGKPRKLAWTNQTRAAFQQLKDCFTTAPILRHPDPDLPFMVEVDASSTGIGAVLSQQHGKPGKLHPCAFYSRKLMAAEANYDIGNRELLSIKVALEEWRHWLEGARWALFFTCFQFLVTYRDPSKPAQANLILPVAAILAPADSSRSLQVLVAITGDGCGEVCSGMPDVRAVSGQPPASGGAAGASPNMPTALVPPVCGFSNRLTRHGRIHYGDGRGGPVLKGV